jgi:hypothetical protein
MPENQVRSAALLHFTITAAATTLASYTYLIVQPRIGKLHTYLKARRSVAAAVQAAQKALSLADVNILSTNIINN